MVKRGFDKFSSNKTLQLATMVDPRMKEIGFDDAESKQRAADLLLPEARKLELTRPTSASAATPSPAPLNTAKNTVFGELERRSAAAQQIAQEVTLTADEEVASYLKQSVIPIKDDPLKW